MAKLTLNGEVFDFDFDHRPMSEALALEHALNMRYADWEAELAAGSMKAMCGLIWLIWRRDGRDIALADILSGDVEVDLTPLLDSLRVLAEEQAKPDPTGPGTHPDPTPATGRNTSPSSPPRSTSGRGRSGS